MLPDDLTKSSSTFVCPVPPEQLPLNEYQELNESRFFRWATLDLPRYIAKILWTWLWSWAIAAPVAAASFPFAKLPAKFLLASTVGAILFVSLVLIRLYLGWAYVSSRLVDSNVVYEESGWYDGQIWTKPPEVLVRDRLIATYEIQPILKRIQQTLGVLAGLLVGGAIVWRLLS